MGVSVYFSAYNIATWLYGFIAAVALKVQQFAGISLFPKLRYFPNVRACMCLCVSVWACVCVCMCWWLMVFVYVCVCVLVFDVVLFVSWLPLSTHLESCQRCTLTGTRMATWSHKPNFRWLASGKFEQWVAFVMIMMVMLMTLLMMITENALYSMSLWWQHWGCWKHDV